MTKLRVIFLCLLILRGLMVAGQSARTIWLDDLVLQHFSDGIRPVKSKTNYGDDSIKIGGVYFKHGIGAQSVSVLAFYLDNKAKGFTAMIGADDKGNPAIPVKFYIVGDRKVLFESNEMRPGDAAQKVVINLEGIERMGLLIKDTVGGVGNKRTYANWANAQLEMIGNHLPTRFPDDTNRYILTPASPKSPRINTAKIIGATPGNPLQLLIATTGTRPMHFSVTGLPAGLKLDRNTGIISGSVTRPGSYDVTLGAVNRYGTNKKRILIKIGDTIALTPPMGWNGWNCWETAIDKEKVIASANAMVKTGLRDHGWTYINIDDSWQGSRYGPLNALQPNEKFPGIKNMFDYIHSLGLKGGLYSTPYIASYGGYPGASSAMPQGGETHQTIMTNRRAFNHIDKYRFEKEDALQMADWGADFLKYDWRIDAASTERMSTALKKSGRDIVFSLSNSAPFADVDEWVRLSNMYRTGPDIRDSWESLYQLAFSLDKWAPYAGHGHWNDPDMMIVGQVTIGPELHPSHLTPAEQFSHISIYSLLGAPMLIGCPIETLDDFTLNLLTNDEIIAIDQDPLGKSARLLANYNGVEIWVKQLEDESYAVGLFNTDNYGKTPQSYFRWKDEQQKLFEFDFAKVGLGGKWQLRDVWRQRGLGVHAGKFDTHISHHGVVMLKMKAIK